MLNVLDYIDDPYLRPYHLDKGREFTVTITGATVVRLPKRGKMKEEDKIALAIKGSKRGLLLNRTNSLTMIRLFGTKDALQYVGKRIVIKAGRFPKDPSAEDRVVIVERHADGARDDGHDIKDDAPPPSPTDTNTNDTGREPGMEG